MSGFFLTILHHDGTEELRDLPEGVLDIGRQPGCWLGPLDPALSRLHARLAVGAESVILTVLPSRNGTRLNGVLVEGDRDLRVSDQILTGRTLLRLGRGSAELERRRLQRTLELREASGRGLVAESPALRRLVEEARKLARTALPILVTGETGVGKEVLARFVHESSSRAEGPFVVVNCPALPAALVESELFGVEQGVATGVTAREGLLERAARGTLFLDEVGDLPLDVQPKLLRFLQEKTFQRVGGRREISVDARILSAANRDLRAAAERGTFRLDLFFRLSGSTLTVPPLRERREDILPLAGRVLSGLPTPHVLSPAAREILLSYPFPGNVRELIAIVERAGYLAEGEEIGPGELGIPSADLATPRAGAPHILDVAFLLDEIAFGRADFWDAVYEPFRRRELPRDAVQSFLEFAVEKSGGGIPELARLLRVEDRYRKLLDFVRNNDLLAPGRRRSN